MMIEMLWGYSLGLFTNDVWPEIDFSDSIQHPSICVAAFRPLLFIIKYSFKKRPLRLTKLRPHDGRNL